MVNFAVIILFTLLIVKGMTLLMPILIEPIQIILWPIVVFLGYTILLDLSTNVIKSNQICSDGNLYCIRQKTNAVENTSAVIFSSIIRMFVIYLSWAWFLS